MGAQWEYEHELQNSQNIARNVVAAILHLAHSRNQITYFRGILVNDFWECNKDFMTRLSVKFYERRKYELNYAILREGMNDFLGRMKWLEEH